MRKFLSLFVVLCSVLTISAQNFVLVLNDTTESSIGLIAKTIDLPKPCSRLTLNAKHTASSVTTDKNALGSLKIEQNVNGTWETLYEDNPGVVTTADRTLPVVGTVIGQYEASVAYEQLSLALNYRATQIRFSRSGLGSTLNDKQVKNIQAQMASFIEVSPKTLDFGEMVVWSEPVTRSYYIEHCNVARPTISSSNTDFALNASNVLSAGVAQYAIDTFTVTFTPNIMGRHEATIVVTNGVQTDSLHCRAKVTKRTPIFTWNVPETIQVGDTIELPVSSDCENLLVLSTCTDELEVLCNKVIAKKAGFGTIEVVQLGDEDYWNNRVEEFSVTIEDTPVVPTVLAPAKAEANAEQYIRNGMVYVRTADTEYLIDGKRR